MARTGWTRRRALAALATTGAAAACGEAAKAPAYEGAVSFSHGVASGDPGIDRVVIWTRVTPAQNGPVPVRWVVARDRRLRNVVKTGIVETTELRDYTVKVDVVGLRAGAPYFYGFLAGDQQSPVGRTRTLPEGKLEKLTFAVASCASFPHGFFNVYEAIARRDDLDLVLHLGDYLYEYGLSGYGGDVGVALGRIPKPEIECVSLGDYRQRHAQYKGEPELQAAHARCPWIVIWDDHEIAADAWMDGAQNHNPEAGEGTWPARKRAALQAYYEWMPLRDPEPGKAFEAANRVFQFGDLATLCLLESRLIARTRPFDLLRDAPLVSAAWDFSNPAAPRPAVRAAHYPPSVRMLPLPHELIGAQLVPIWDWPRVSAALAKPANPGPNIYFLPDMAKLNEVLAAPERTMLGRAQEQWLERQLTASHRHGIVWQLIGDQSLMTRALAPDLSRLAPAAVAALEARQPGISKYLFYTRFGAPLNLGAWDGYPADRARVLDIVRAVGGNTIVLSGDSRAAWASELPASDGSRIAVELSTASVTAPGLADLAPGVDFDAAVLARNPQAKWTDQRHRGYLLVMLTKENAQAEFITVSTVASKQFTTETAARFTIRPDDAPGLGPLTRASAG
ncbi:MAG: alkaline phosphatase [Hyphomonadaceae bacterium]